MIVLHLFTRLPQGYRAAPFIRRGEPFESDAKNAPSDGPVIVSGEGDATTPTLTFESNFPEQDEYEVRIYDDRHRRTLVAAIEIVSPSNKDRPERRRAFVAKTAALLQRGVCVSIVDLVTVRQFNLYADLLELIGAHDPALGDEPPLLYAATVRGRKRDRKRPLLETWFYALEPGRPLPSLPIWLEDDRGLLVDLEATYEDTCRALRIR
jgi:hypothetical protein